MIAFQERWNALIAPHRLIWITETYPTLTEDWTELEVIRTKTYSSENDTRYMLVFTKPEGGRFELILTQHAVTRKRTVAFKKGEWELFSFVNNRVNAWIKPYQKKEVNYLYDELILPHFDELRDIAVERELQQEIEAVETLYAFMSDTCNEWMGKE